MSIEVIVCVKQWAEGADTAPMGLYDLHQRNQINATRHSLSTTQSEVMDQRRRSENEIAALEQRVERLTMLCEAMWELVGQTTGLTGEHLARMVDQLDARDGERNRSHTPGATQCGCGAMVNARVTHCQFCGEAAPARSLFDMI